MDVGAKSRRSKSSRSLPSYKCFFVSFAVLFFTRDAETSSDDMITPQNTVTVVNTDSRLTNVSISNVSFHCWLPHHKGGYIWTRRAAGSREYIIYSGEQLNQIYNKTFRVDVDGFEENISTRLVFLTTPQAEDAAAYTCKRARTDKPFTAELVVLESDPVCNFTLAPDNIKNDPAFVMVDALCILNYTGSLVPTITWHHIKSKFKNAQESAIEPGQVATTRTHLKLTSQVFTRIPRDDILLSKFFFSNSTMYEQQTSATPGSGTGAVPVNVDKAGNVPNYNYIWKSPPLIFPPPPVSTTVEKPVSEATSRGVVITTPHISTSLTDSKNSTTLHLVNPPAPHTPRSTTLSPSGVPEEVTAAMAVVPVPITALIIGVVCAFVGLIIIFVNVVIGISCYRRRSPTRRKNQPEHETNELIEASSMRASPRTCGQQDPPFLPPEDDHIYQDINNDKRSTLSMLAHSPSSSCNRPPGGGCLPGCGPSPLPSASCGPGGPWEGGAWRGGRGGGACGEPLSSVSEAEGTRCCTESTRKGCPVHSQYLTMPATPPIPHPLPPPRNSPPPPPNEASALPPPLPLDDYKREISSCVGESIGVYRVETKGGDVREGGKDRKVQGGAVEDDYLSPAEMGTVYEKPVELMLNQELSALYEEPVKEAKQEEERCYTPLLPKETHD